MNNFHDWANREIETALEGETDDWIRSVYEAAAKAFDYICESVEPRVSVEIINKLIDRIPLTPILDIPDDWNEVINPNSGVKTYQNRRRSSLFKDVSDDGKVVFSDVDRCTCIDINDSHQIKYHSGIVTKLINKMYPITFPYVPLKKPIEVHCESFLIDEKNGDFDTYGIFEATFPDGVKVLINKFYKEVDGNWKEIGMTEYFNRKNLQIRPTY